MTQETQNDDTSPKPVAANDIVTDAKAWLADIGPDQRLQTHSANCHRWHSTCLVSKLTREIERLRTLAEQATHGEGSVRGEGTETVGQRLVERLSITQAMLDDNEVLRAEIDRLRLSAEEREAIETADAYMSAAGCHNTNVQKTLRKLLERLK
jgi:hypothetical protein